MTEDQRQINEVTEEFVFYRVTPDHQLPSFDPSTEAAIDYFWAVNE